MIENIIFTIYVFGKLLDAALQLDSIYELVWVFFNGYLRELYKKSVSYIAFAPGLS